MLGILIKKLLSTLTPAQIVTFVAGTLAPILISMIPNPDLQKSISDLVGPLMATLLVILRKPSTEGGSLKTAQSPTK